jgi:hypothetical protein
MNARYIFKVDPIGSKYLGLSIVFDRVARTVSLSLPNYIAKALKRFAPDITHGAPTPTLFTKPVFGRTQQLAAVDYSPRLSAEQTTTLREIVGVYLYYARMVDCTMLPAVTALASAQSKATVNTMKDAERLIAYSAAYPLNSITYCASDMVLFSQVDASFRSRPNAGSVAGSISYFGNTDSPTMINGNIRCTSSLIDVVVGSAAEAEYAALYLNATDLVFLRQICSIIGYPQPPTIILCDNACAVGLANDTMKVRASKAIDGRFHWVRDRIRQGQFNVQWRKGEYNLADYFTKSLPFKAHIAMVPLLVHKLATSTAILSPQHLRSAKRVYSTKL